MANFWLKIKLREFDLISVKPMLVHLTELRMISIFFEGSLNFQSIQNFSIQLRTQESSFNSINIFPCHTGESEIPVVIDTWESKLPMV